MTYITKLSKGLAFKGKNDKNKLDGIGGIFIKMQMILYYSFKIELPLLYILSTKIESLSWTCT